MSVLDDLSALHRVLDEIALMAFNVLATKHDVDSVRAIAIAEKGGEIASDQWISNKIIHSSQQFDDLRESYVAFGHVFQNPIHNLMEASGPDAVVTVNGIEMFPHVVARNLGLRAADLLRKSIAQFPLDILCPLIGERNHWLFTCPSTLELDELNEQVEIYDARIPNNIAYSPHRSARLYRRRMTARRWATLRHFRGATQTLLRSKLALQFAGAKRIALSPRTPHTTGCEIWPQEIVDQLKRNQKTLAEQMNKNNGRVEIGDFADIVGWEEPLDNAAGALVVRFNKTLEKLNCPDRIRRYDNAFEKKTETT